MSMVMAETSSSTTVPPWESASVKRSNSLAMAPQLKTENGAAARGELS